MRRDKEPLAALTDVMPLAQVALLPTAAASTACASASGCPRAAVIRSAFPRMGLAPRRTSQVPDLSLGVSGCSCSFSSGRFWVMLRRRWPRWREALVIVKPETVVAWHRRLGRWWQRWQSRPLGRPPLPDHVQALIRRMAAENPLWGQDRIAGELGRGYLDQVYIKGENGYVVLMSVGEEAVLTVLARREAKLGLVFLDMRRCVEELTKIV